LIVETWHAFLAAAHAVTTAHNKTKVAWWVLMMTMLLDALVQPARPTFIQHREQQGGGCTRIRSMRHPLTTHLSQ
jgi:hypothetical protein